MDFQQFKYICVLLFVGICLAVAFPDNRNPNLDYELITGGAQKVNTTATTTRRPVVIRTPPPVDPNSKTFAFEPISKSWTELKKNSPPPAEDTLIWNQSNDKFLTRSER